MSSTKQDTSPVPSRRRFRLHWLSWLALLFMSSAMMIIIVPGSIGHSIEWEHERLINLSPGEPPKWTPYDYIDVRTSSHGWPFEYLRRRYEPRLWLIEFNGFPVEWSQTNAWLFSGKVYAFSLFRLLADALIGVAIVAVAIGACESWRRRRNGFRFSLLDGGVLVTTIGMFLGWWQYHVRTQATEHAIKTALTADGSFTDRSNGGRLRAAAIEDYCGPDWLQRLLGNPYLIPFCHHIDRLDVDSALLSTDDYAAIRKLRYVETVQCTGKLKSELVDALSALPKLRTLDGYFSGIGGGPPIPEPTVTSSEAPYLARLFQLTTLNLGYSEIHPADIQHIALMPRLQTLHLRGNDILIEDLEPLATCPTLKTVYADIVATNEERRAFDSAHPRLTVRWARPYVPGPSDPLTLQASPTDPWNVAAVLLRRWQTEDHAKPGNGPVTIDRDHLDFSDIRLTQQRLRRLPLKRFPDVKSVAFGEVDFVETAMEVLGRCGPLDELEIRYVPLSRSELDAISFRKEANLWLQQGPLKVDEICEFARKLKPNSIDILASTFSAAEVQRLMTLPDVIVFVYKGFREDENERLDLFYEDHDPSPNPFQ